MRCVNCTAEARRIDSATEDVELVCPECGHFSVSESVMRQRKSRPFDTEQTRIWLHSEREINPDRCPQINTENVIWALR
jgi:predicted RNA-binding Zn-ribbon protein involved in translation (DUF1610 family)